jgi:lysophospholipase L1-like esterase
MNTKKITGLLIAIFLTLQFAKNQTIYKFDFGTGKVAEGYILVTPSDAYTPEKGYGFDYSSNVLAIDSKGKDALLSDYISGDKPFYFSVSLPEGNYNIIITFGDKKGVSTSTVKCESRRLMLEKLTTQKGEFATRTFTVNLHTPKINDSLSVRLKPRELGYLNWDNKLTFEFSNERPCLCAMEIQKADNVTTLFLAGNSTVVDQDKEPWAAWGQMIPCFFKQGVSVANFAESGESLSSFISSRRLAKVLSLIKPGDYLFIEFGHNDQKQKGEGIGPWTSYKNNLIKFITETREKGGIPVLVTSMHRRNFDSTGHIINTLGDYPDAVRQTAKELNVPLIDLNAMSKILYEAWGPEDSKKAFVHYPANSFPGQDKALADNTHFSTYGAYQIAKCILEGIKANNLGLVPYIVDDFKGFDPSKPDPIANWNWPLSPMVSNVKPDGN